MGRRKAGQGTEADRLLQEYKDPQTTDERVCEIVTRLYNLGYKIRLRDGQFCLMNRKTGEFVQK